MLIYLFSESFFLILSLLENRRNRFLFFVVCSILFFIILGFHDGQLGGRADYPHYLNLFLGRGYSMYGSLDYNNGYDLEMPYYYFCKFLRFFGRFDFVYIWGYALMVGVPLMILIRKYSKNYALSFFFFLTVMTSQMLVFVMHAHRQMLSTSFFLIALLIFNYIREKQIGKSLTAIMLYLVVVLCVFVAVIAHSSSYLLVPFAIFIYVLNDKKKFTRKAMIVAIAVSVPLGLVFNAMFGTMLNKFMFALGGVDFLERTTFYLVGDNWMGGSAPVVKQILQSITAISFVYYTKENEKQSFFLLCFCFATIVFNLFSTVPLINRSMTLLFVLGCVGGVPRLSHRSWILLVIMMVNMYMDYRWYAGPYFNLTWVFLWS